MWRNCTAFVAGRGRMGPMQADTVIATHGNTDFDAFAAVLAAIRRLIVVETVHASRLGELESVALDPQVEKIVFDHHAGEPPGWASPEHTILSEDGALTTTLVGILAERE